jgi:hypothetical protein
MISSSSSALSLSTSRQLLTDFHIWFVDDVNGISSFELSTLECFEDDAQLSFCGIASVVDRVITIFGWFFSRDDVLHMI